MTTLTKAQVEVFRSEARKLLGDLAEKHGLMFTQKGLSAAWNDTSIAIKGDFVTKQSFAGEALGTKYVATSTELARLDLNLLEIKMSRATELKIDGKVYKFVGFKVRSSTPFIVENPETSKRYKLTIEQAKHYRA